MKMILKILIVLVVLIAILLIIPLFVKNEYSVEREVTINAPKNEVFDYVKYLKNQDHYSKWNMTDPNSKKEYKGTDGTLGFVYAWDSENKNVGKGEQELKQIQEGERLEMELRFVRPFENIGQTYMTTQSLSDQETKLTWGMNGRNKYPFNFMNLFIDNILGKDLEVSLQNLKTILEK